MSYKERLKRPPLTEQEARNLANDTITRLHTAEQALTKLGAVLDYIYPLCTLEQQQAMEAMLLEKP